MKIGDEVFVHGYVDEIRNDVIIIRNDGGYFGTVGYEVVDKDAEEYKRGRIDALNELMEYTYGMLTAEKFGLQHHIKSMIWDAMDTADTPQTETKRVGYCNECKWFRNKQVCGRCRSKNLFAEADTPQTDCDHKCIQTEVGCEQTDCPWK